MPVILGIPILIFSVVIQTTAFSRLPMLYGTADIVMLVVLAWMLNDRVKHGWAWVVMAGLMVSTVSALPFFTHLWSYCIAAGLCYWLKKRIWQTPVLAMLVSSFFGTLVVQSISLLVLQVTDSGISMADGFNLVILPCILWNLIMAIPIYTLVNEFATWVYPQEVQI
jgi:hypothetical protein